MVERPARERSGPRNAAKTRSRGHGGRHRQVAAGDALAEARAGRADAALLDWRRACRCGRSPSPPRRRSAGRRAPGTPPPRAAHVLRRRPAAMPAAPCTSGSITTAASSRGVLVDQRDRHVDAVRGRRRRAPAAPGSGAGRTRRCRSRRRRPRATRSCRRGRRRRRRGSVVRARDALVGPVLERDLQRLLDGRGTVAGEEQVGVVHGHDGARAPRPARSSTRLPLPSIVEWATRSIWSRSAWSSSGTRWPRVVTHSDEMASR